MSVNIMQFKSRIRNLAQEEGIPAQVMLQNFMFERFFARLCKSTVRENLILKGGALISQYLGISRRTTMDIDLTMSNAPLTESTVSEMIQGVFSVRLDDGVRWSLNVLEPIRNKDLYGGYRAKIVATLDSIAVPFSIDISTGDVITPEPEDYFFKSAFEKNAFYNLKAYTIETVLAEKLESILSLGVLSTRPRDYYDVYMLTSCVKHSDSKLKAAFLATIHHRGSEDVYRDGAIILTEISRSEILKNRWGKYRQQFSFADHISFEQICNQLITLFGGITAC